jgi:hypothetical protein
MAIEGTYGFVYGGANGLGVGFFTVEGERLRGIDYVGGRYDGTARENPDGTILIAIEFDVLPGMVLVQGTPPQELPYRRKIEQTMPQGFGDGRPVELATPPGGVTFMIKRVPDEASRAISECIYVSIGADRIR